MSADGAARLAGRIERQTSPGNKLLPAGGEPPLFALVADRKSD